MSEEVPETADGAIRGWIIAVGFTLVLVGGELMAEKDGIRFYSGLGLAVAALPCYLSVALWKTVKPKLGLGFLTTLNEVATDARWWMGAIFVILLSFILSPAVSLASNRLPIETILGFAAVGCLSYFIWKNFRRTEKTDFSQCPYVGRMNVDFSKMETEHVLEIGGMAFNGALASISIGEVGGHIKCKLPLKTDAHGTVIVDTAFPTPRLKVEIINSLKNIPPCRELVFIIEQVVSKEIIEGLNMLLSQKDIISFELSELNIAVNAVGKSDDSWRIPLWDAINCRQLDIMNFSKVTNAVGLAIAGASATIGKS
jgi:hypothetical protein